jgi:hypothetical protein
MAFGEHRNSFNFKVQDLARRRAMAVRGIPDEIQIPEWAGHGTGMVVRRQFLAPEHEWSEYNYVRQHYPDIDPAEFGIRVPSKTPCPHCGCTCRREESENYGKN